MGDARLREHMQRETATVVPSARRAVELDPRLDLQRQVGNRTAGVLLAAQTALEVGRADDPLEAEADRAADQVVNRLSAGRSDDVARQLDGGADGVARSLRRREDGIGAIGPEGGAVDEHVERELSSARQGGQPLSPSVRQGMESAFGADFGRVRIHQGAQSDSLNRSLGAKAFTLGNDIFFKGSAPNAGTSSGQHLLAHELAHTVQQGAAAPVSRHADAEHEDPSAAIAREAEGPEEEEEEQA